MDILKEIVLLQKNTKGQEKTQKKNKDYNRWRGLIKIRTDEIYKIFGMLKKIKFITVKGGS